MWRIYVNISWFQIVVVTCAVAQGYVPSNTQTNKPQAQNSQMGYGFSSPSSGSFESETFQTMAQRAFDPTSDSMDFQENFQWKGRSFQLANQRVFRARFERFLLASPAAESIVYGQILQQVEDLLSVGNLPDYETLAQAWDLLFKAHRIRPRWWECFNCRQSSLPMLGVFVRRCVEKRSRKSNYNAYGVYSKRL